MHTDWQDRIIRYRDLIPSTHAFIDTRTPGSDKKENFCLIGPGVAEDPGQHVHIGIPHGFNVGGARQPSGCKNSHHSHETAEVFIVHRGSWKFTWGVDGSDGEKILNAGDTISIPVRVFRGFENVGDDDGFLFAVLGGDDPGHVTWAPYVFEDARHFGMVLLEDGRLIDTAAGDEVPEGAKRQAPPTAQEVAEFRQMSAADMAGCVAPNNDLKFCRTSSLGALDGVEEAPVIGLASTAENLPAGKLDWEHGFQVRRVTIDPGAGIRLHQRGEEEVVFVHHGQLDVVVGDKSQTLEEGDLITTPIGLGREYRNNGDQMCELVIVRGGNAAMPPQWA